MFDHALPFVAVRSRKSKPSHRQDTWSVHPKARSSEVVSARRSKTPQEKAKHPLEQALLTPNKTQTNHRPTTSTILFLRYIFPRFRSIAP